MLHKDILKECRDYLTELWVSHYGTIFFSDDSRFQCAIPWPLEIKIQKMDWLILGKDQLVYHMIDINFNSQPIDSDYILKLAHREAHLLLPQDFQESNMPERIIGLSPQFDRSYLSKISNHLHRKFISFYNEAYQENPDFINGDNYWNEISNHLVNKAKPQWDEFISFFDQDALKYAFKASLKGNIQSYNIFQGAGAPEGRQKESAQWRQQAFEQWPAFFMLFRSDAKVINAIDNSKPLVKAIAESLHIKETTVKVFRNQPVDAIDVAKKRNRSKRQDLLMHVVDAIPLTWIHAGQKDVVSWRRWKNLCNFFIRSKFLPYNHSGSPYKMTNPYHKELLEDIIKRQGRDFEYLDGWRIVNSNPIIPHIDHIKDMIDNFKVEILYPMFLKHESFNNVILNPDIDLMGFIMDFHDNIHTTVLNIFMGTRSPSATLALSQEHLRYVAFQNRNVLQWLAEQNNINLNNPIQESATLEKANSWFPLAKEEFIISPQDVIIKDLTTADELYREGNEMSHCVGGYSGACISNHCKIISLKSASERSTAEITISHNGQIECLQHKTYNNLIKTFFTKRPWR